MHARKEVIDKFRWYCLNMDYSNNELTGAPTDKIIRKLKFARINTLPKKILGFRSCGYVCMYVCIFNVNH